MRKYFTLVLWFVIAIVQAQPTITMNDMPSVGDTIKTRSTILAPGINYQQTGANFTWDFSSLSSTNVNADTFIAVSATPLMYQLAFNLPFDPNKSNLASPQTDINLIPGMPLTDIIQFYRKATASYGNWGFGAKLAGIPVPIKFNAQDIQYHFPLTAASPPDSTDVSFSQGITGIGYLSIQRKRVNTVDGYGTMITPIGSYYTLRVKSIVTESDSIYVDSLNIGFNIPRNYIEYKWLANGKGIPVMKVTNENLVPTFIWQDSAATGSGFSVSIGQPGPPVCVGTSVQLTATPSGGTSPYFFIWSNGGFGQTITVTPTVTTTYSVTVTDASFQFATASITITVYPNPDATIIKNPDMQEGCSNIIGFDFTLTAPSGYSMYTWSTGVSGTTMNSISVSYPSFNYIGLVNYWVDVVDQHGCIGSDTTSIFWSLCEGIQNLSKKPEFSMYPNPSNGILRIDYSQSEASSLSIEIYNALGTLVKRMEPGTCSLNGSQVIDFKSFTNNNGIYFVRLGNKNGSTIKAVILE